MSLNRKLSFTAILSGVGLDIGCSILITAVLSVYHAILLLTQGVPESELGARVSELLAASTWLLFASSFCTVLGGFVTGWIARNRQVRHALYTGIGSLTVGLGLLLSSGANPYVSRLYEVLGLASVVPLALLGGYLSTILSPAPKGPKGP